MKLSYQNIFPLFHILNDLVVFKRLLFGLSNFTFVNPLQVLFPLLIPRTNGSSYLPLFTYCIHPFLIILLLLLFRFRESPQWSSKSPLWFFYVLITPV